jgi:hypothetical protein
MRIVAVITEPAGITRILAHRLRPVRQEIRPLTGSRSGLSALSVGRGKALVLAFRQLTGVRVSAPRQAGTCLSDVDL